MKTLLIATYLFIISVSLCFAQSKKASDQNETLIDLYFKPYSGEERYEVNTMGEEMVKRTNEMGMWTHPGIARIMKQVKTYKYLNFNASPERLQEILNQADANIKKAGLYKEYYRWELNGKTSSIIYTRGPANKVTELVNLTIGKKSMVVSCFIGDNIDMESIRSLAQNK